MRRKHLLWLCLPLFPVLGSLLPLLFAADGIPSEEPAPDPVPLRRVLLPPERLAAEMERAREGTLVQLSRADFEERVKSAAQVGQGVKNPPRLIDARYHRVKVKDSALVGSAEWKVLNPGSGPGLLSLSSPGFALRQVRWSDGKPALFGDLDGKELSLLVDTPGERALFLEWSARGVPAGNGLRFSLDLPSCAVASLELELHRDFTVAIARDAGLLTGPHPAEQADHHTWRIAFAGRSQLNFEVRRTRGNDVATPLVLHRLKAMQELKPANCEADYDFTLEVLHGGVSELRCECTPELRPYEVNVRHLDRWAIEKAPNASPVLVIRFREPFEGGPLQVRCLAPLTSDKPWVSPALRLLNSVPRGETLEVRVDGELQMQDWKSAGFRLVRTAFQADGKQVLSLAANVEGGANPERPSARFPVAGPDYKVRQLTWWQIGCVGQAPSPPMPGVKSEPCPATLTSQLTYEVNRGKLFRLPLLLPAGWDVETVDCVPTDLLRHWSVDKGKPPQLLAELVRGVEPGTSARLIVRLRSTQPLKVPAAGAALAFPDLVPQDARLREGALGISISPLLDGRATASVPAAAPESAGEADAGASGDAVADARPSPTGAVRVRPPWGKQLPDYFFPFKGQAIEGSLQLRPRPTQFRAVCHSDVVLASSRGLALIRLELQPEVGAPETVDLFITGPVLGRWDWQTVRGGNSVKRMEPLTSRQVAAPLSVLAARNAVGALALAALPPHGSWWRLTLARPLTKPLTLEASVELTGEAPAVGLTSAPALLGSREPLGVVCLAAAAQRSAEHATKDRRWEVPLVLVPEAERRDGRVALHLAGADLVHVESSGLEEAGDTTAAPSHAPGPAFAWRTYRYGTLPMSLALSGRAPAADRSAETVVDRAFLFSSLESDGSLRHHFRFQVWNWRQQTLPVRLPAGARVLAVRADGVWLDVVPLGRSANNEELVELPAAGTKPLHRFEILYSGDVHPNFWGARLEAPAPSLPLEPLAFRRTWGLPVSVAPLASASFRRLPGGSADVSKSNPPALASLLDGAPEDRSARLERQLTEALARLRKQYRPGEPVPLDRLLGTLAYEDFKEPVPLVLDTWALNDAALTCATRLAPASESPRRSDAVPFAGDLVIVPCQSALLVTTRGQYQAAQASAGADEAAFGTWDAAITEGFVFGHDSSSRFRRVDDWLEDEGGPTRGGLAQLGSDRTEWEAVAGRDDGSLTVVRPQVYSRCGLMLAVLLPLTLLWLGRPKSAAVGPAVRIAWFLLLAFTTALEMAVVVDLCLRWLGARPSERFGRRFLLAWLVISGLALLWMPPGQRDLAWWPALVAIPSACIWFAWSAAVRAAIPRPTLPRTVVTLLLLVGLFGSAGQAAAPGPATVYLVNDGDKQTVLAPSDLLDQLATLGRRGVSGLRGAVLLGADYEGRADHQTAQLEARFRVHSFSDEPTVLLLPLGGVQLTEALVDGAAAQPLAVRQPREGYTLEIKGRGSHNLVLRFAVPLLVNGEERDLRFTVPELAQSRLVLDVPASAGHVHAVEGRGWHHTSNEEKQCRLEADLGKVSSVRVRWRRDGNQPRTTTVRVQEAYYWDLEASSSRLLAVLQYTVSNGWETNFRIDLPRELEVYSAEAGPLANGPPAPRLRWLVREEGQNRRLVLDFQGPVTGGVQVTLVLVPRQPFGRTVVLPFPTPVDAKQSDSFLAYRTDGLEASVANHHAISGIERDHLAKTFAESFAQPWRSARQEEPAAPTRAVWRGKGGVLHLILRPPPSPVRAAQEITWQIAPRQAGLRASVRLTAADNNLSFVEWEVPANLGILEVSGPHLRSWSLVGSRLQIWLQKPVGETTLQLAGWLPRGPGDTRFDLPLVRLDVRPLTTTLRISGDGLSLKPALVSNLTPRSDTTVREYSYSCDQDTYGGSFTTRSASIKAEFRLLTFAEVRERQLTVVTTLRAEIARGDLRYLTVAVRNWEGKELTLDAPKVARRREQLASPGGPVWMLELEPGVKDSYQFTLTGTVPLTATTDVLLPDVRVETTSPAAVHVERWLAVAGPELSVEDAFGLEARKDGAAAVSSWPREAERLRRAGGRVWEVKAEEWRLRLRPRSAGSRPAPVQVYLTEHAAAVSDGRRWAHQATFWLYHEAGADLNVTLPAGAEVLAVTLDGEGKPPLQPAPERLWLPLPGGRGGRVVRLAWAFKADRERTSLGAPFLEAPRLDGVAEGPIVWTIHVPAGYDIAEGRPAKSSPRPVQPGSAAALDLWRASAHLRLLRQLVEQAPNGGEPSQLRQVQTAQHEFERYARQAAYQLGLPEASLGDTGPVGQGLSVWLQELRSQYADVVRAHHLPAPPVERAARPVSTGTAESCFPFDLTPFDRGQPHYWQSVTGAEAPPLRLVAQTTQENRQALTWSTLLLVLLLAVWILVHFFRATWPEQMALLGCLGALLLGSVPGLVFLLLPLGCVGYRIFGVGGWSLRWLRGAPVVVPGAR